MKRRLSTPVETLRRRAEASAAQAERVRERLAQHAARAAADTARYNAALEIRARRDALRHMRGQS